MRKTKAKPGRRTRIASEPSLTDLLCKFLREGLGVRTACELCNFAESTFYSYMARADTEPEFKEFAEGVTRARAEGTQHLHRVIVEAAPVDWKAARVVA